MPNQEFDEVVAAAAADAFASRKQLGFNYAEEFSEDPEAFDPRKLIVLGREGLQSFIATVSVPTREVEQASASEVKIADPVPANLGWRDQQNVPLSFELSAVLIGAMAGIAIVFGSAILLTI